MLRPKQFSIILIVLALLGLSGCDTPQSSDIQPEPAVVPTEVSETAAVEPSDNAQPPADEQSNLALAPANFTIISAESAARFELDETLKSAQTGWHSGARVTVVGTTNEVFGSFSLSPTDAAATQFNEIRIDADTFKTDNFYRTAAIRRTVLDSGTYPDIIFSPTGIRGLPDAVALGEAVVFNLDGDLTVRDISLAQSFVVTATLVAPNRVEGTALTTVTRESYGLEIRVAPHVTDVDDEVHLFIDFVALSE